MKNILTTKLYIMSLIHAHLKSSIGYQSALALPKCSSHGFSAKRFATLCIAILCAITINTQAQHNPDMQYYIISFLSPYNQVTIQDIGAGLGRPVPASFMLEKNDIVLGYVSQKDPQQLIFTTKKGPSILKKYTAEINIFSHLSKEISELQNYNKANKIRQYLLEIETVRRKITALENNVAIAEPISSLNQNLEASNYKSLNAPSQAVLNAQERKEIYKKKQHIKALEEQEANLLKAMDALPEEVPDKDVLISKYKALLKNK